MKAAFLLALFGAMLAVSVACPEVAYHSCVKEEKPTKCKAIQVCEDGQKEKCGEYECEYPFICAWAKKEECKDFVAVKEKCEKKKVCKEVLKPCGYGACGLNQDCVKETVCYVKNSHYGRKLMKGGSATANAFAKAEGDDAKAAAAANAESDGGYAEANAVAIAKSEDNDDKHYGNYYDPPHYYGRDHDDLICKDEYKCVAKEPCRDVVIKKCVKSELRPGVDVCHGGFYFNWYGGVEGEACGDEYCGYGYKCADVIIQECKTPCGDYDCDYGYECIADEEEECENYAYLSTVCRDVYEPTCVKLSDYCQLHYKPPCKTVYECEKEEDVCGHEYCPEGYVCAVDYKKACGYTYQTAYNLPVVEKPVKYEEPKYTYYSKPTYYEPEPEHHYYEPEPEHHYYEPEPEHHYEPEPESKHEPETSAESHTTAIADGNAAIVDVNTKTKGDAEAAATGYSETENSAANGSAYSAEGEAEVLSTAEANEDGYAESNGDATSD